MVVFERSVGDAYLRFEAESVAQIVELLEAIDPISLEQEPKYNANSDSNQDETQTQEVPY